MCIRDSCCPAARVPVAVVLPCGVCCCIAENKQNTIINRKTELCHHRPQTKAHSNEYENNTHKVEQGLPAWRGAGRSSRGTKPLLSCSDGARSYRITLRCLLLYCWQQTKYNHHIVRLVHKNHIIRTCLMYHAACKVEFQPFTRSYSQLTFFNFL